LLGQIKEKYGYSHEYILWSLPWLQFQLEMADAPRYVREEEQAVVISSAKEASALMGGRRGTMIIKKNA
jgi:hypothetical protein